MAKRAIRWSADAQRDLEDIFAFVAQDSEINALQVFDRLCARVDSLATLPERGRLVPEITVDLTPPLHELIEGPWRIMYAFEQGRVVVVAIVDSRRDIAAWLRDRFHMDMPDPP